MIVNDFWAGRRVLITGHTGFKGSWLTLWLQNLGADIWGYSLPPQTSPSLFQALELNLSTSAQCDGKFSHYYGDINNAKDIYEFVQVAQPEIVIHLAAQPLVHRSYVDPLGTWLTNVQGSLNLLEALKTLNHQCAVVMVTTDKVYINREWDYGYREEDRLGGHDPYSASKAAAEIAISSWRASFCGQEEHQSPFLSIATARAGNVIGGGDWSDDRIVPDAIKSLRKSKTIGVRFPQSTRPWQHVLEPLGGYLLLAQKLFSEGARFSEAFNFGPSLEANRSVQELVQEILLSWHGQWEDLSGMSSFHEAGRLHLQIDKAYHKLDWNPRWNFATTVKRTVNWYYDYHNGKTAVECCQEDLKAYASDYSNSIT